MLGFKIYDMAVYEDNLNMFLVGMHWNIFAKALTTICDHPLLSHVKQLHIKQKAAMSRTRQTGIANEVWKLFSSLPPLDELTIPGCDLHIPLAGLFNNQRLYHLGRHNAFPQIKELEILNPSMGVDETECAEAIMELTKSQHALGKPFKCVTVRTQDLHPGIVERLRRRVIIVDWSVWCEKEEEEEEV